MSSNCWNENEVNTIVENRNNLSNGKIYITLWKERKKKEKRVTDPWIFLILQNQQEHNQSYDDRNFWNVQEDDKKHEFHPKIKWKYQFGDTGIGWERFEL